MNAGVKITRIVVCGLLATLKTIEHGKIYVAWAAKYKIKKNENAKNKIFASNKK